MTLAEVERALSSPDAEVRREAVLQARKARSAALGAALIAALGDRDFRVRQEAIYAVAEQAIDLDLVPQLVEALAQNDDVARRNAAREVLRNVGGAAVGTLVAALTQVDDGARKFVVEALACSSAHAALPALVSAARGADSSLAIAAMDALAHLGGADAVLVLRQCLREGSTLARVAALDALVRLGVSLPWDELSPLLTERVMRRVVPDALGYSLDPRAVRPLLACVVDKSAHVAARSVVALSRLSHESSPARPALIVALRQAPQDVHARLSLLSHHDDPDVARAAVTALSYVQAAGAVPATTASAPITSTRTEIEAFQRLRKLVNQAAGILLTEDSQSTVERKLEARVQALGLGGFAEYCHSLSQRPDRSAELERVLDLLSTHETYFFRDLPQLHAFEHEVLPELAKSASRRKSLRVWSAGCSTGEEVYTLAILIERSGLFRGWDVRVVGTDRSSRVVEAARRGAYREPSFRAMPADHDGWFVASAEGRTVTEGIRAACHFEQRNLLDVAGCASLGSFDAVFCRNVLIYFDQASRRRVVESFYESLRPGGYLMLGHSESLLHMSTAFELAHLRGDLGYRKPHAHKSLPPKDGAR